MCKRLFLEAYFRAPLMLLLRLLQVIGMFLQGWRLWGT